MKNGKQIMTVVYIPFANPPVLIFCYHIKKACQYPDILFPLSYPPNDVRTSVLYLSAFFPHYLFILIGKEHNHLVGKTEPDS